MQNRPRIALVVYGSLLDPTDLASLLTSPGGRVLPIRVHGFKRICNQAASWRAVEDDQRAVLNVVPAEDAWFNGLLVTGIQRAEFETFRDRERGYRLVEVPDDQLEPYDTRELNTDQLGPAVPRPDATDLTLVTTGTKVDDEIRPIRSYLDQCLDAARQWGETFATDFESTTETNAGVTVRTYLDSQ